MNKLYSRKTLTIIYTLLFVILIAFASVIIVFSAINTSFNNQTQITNCIAEKH